ncbi:Shikimate kinase [Nocardia africana]|uniref:Shikimate kinase n=1 Tax=Nocardia africana TaxID=134964 RepID=A0A378WYM1_9NOCA|nr:Shikimate kinase [Nocardia africana]
MIVRSDPSRPSVILIGPPGAGKSTIGRKLARELGVSLYDTDAGIEQDTGRSIPEIFATDGEPEFRRIEERVVRRAILAEHGVVSLGGGAILSAATRELLRGRTVVYLEISVAEGLRRTGASTNRPLLNGDDPSAKYRELMRVRRPLYREVASIRIRTDGRSPGRVVRAILAKLGVEPAETPAPQPDPPSPEPAGTRRSRPRGRRRRTRAAADGATRTTSEPGETDAAHSDSTEADRTQPRRRARRSRRGGRRHSRNRTDTPPIGAASERPTASPESAAAGAGAKPAAAQSNARPGRVRRTATRAAGPPASSQNPHAATAPHPEPVCPVRSGPETRPSPGADETPSPAGHFAGNTAQTAHESAPGAGRSRRARARRARLRRALEESEQHI